MSGIDRWARIWNAQSIVAGALLSVITSVVTVDFFGSYFGSRHHVPQQFQSLVGHVAGFAFVVFTSTVVAGSILGAFRRGDTRALLITVLVSYFSLMLVFASVYYEAAFFGDFQDAVFQYDRYRADALAGADGPTYESRRAFAGIEPRFWSGVDWPVRAGTFPNGLPPGSYRLSTSQIREIAAKYPIESVVQFIPEARLSIFADCLHLSIITMTTVGYGDITPRSVPSRIAADTEAVCNSLLLIFGVGIIFGTRSPVAPVTKPGG